MLAVRIRLPHPIKKGSGKTKILALALAASLCVGSASAANVYDLERDTQLMSLDKAVSTASADDTWYESVLQNLEWIMFDMSDVCEFLYDISNKIGPYDDTSIFGQLWSLIEYSADSAIRLGAYDSIAGSYLSSSGKLLNVPSEISIAELLQMGFAGVANHLLVYGGNTVLMETGLTGTVNSSGFMPFSGLVRRGFLGLSANINSLSQSNSAAVYAAADLIGTDVETASLLVNSSIASLIDSNVSVVNSAANTLKTQIQSSTTTLKTEIDQMDSNLTTTRQQLSDDLHQISNGSYFTLLFDGSGLLGSPGEFVDAGELNSMGEALVALLQFVQFDLGRLSYLYADLDSVQAKKDSQDNQNAALEGFVSPGSVGGVSASDLGDAATAVGGTKELFDTGVSIGQAFDQLQGSGPLEFFTSVTASNLNTVPATYSDDDDFVHFYDPSNSEFFELIGKGGD